MPAEIDLTQLFAPRSVAILGASAVPSPGRYIIETLQNFGFEGGIYLVSPNSEIVADTPYYDALFNMPEAPDVVAFCVSSTRALDAFRTLPDIGARAAADSGKRVAQDRPYSPKPSHSAKKPELRSAAQTDGGYQSERAQRHLSPGRADAAGFTSAMHAGLDVLAPLYVPKTDVGVQFTEIRQKEGLRAALTWRRDQIKQYEDLRTCVKRQIGRFQKRYWALRSGKSLCEWTKCWISKRSSVSRPVPPFLTGSRLHGHLVRRLKDAIAE
ncbi:MAG: CoA-binding protein [Pseudomonadota bacterium]|nr:CoA-binding protein [Pseudomonadota bacterium]